MAGINCREQFEAVEWLDDLDLLKECPAGYRKSAFYKNLLFKMRAGLRYVGVGIGRVHETFNIQHGWRVKLLPADKYWYVHCFDEETEILTREGWKRFADLTEGDEVMTLNPETGRMEYQKPVEIIKHHYKGYMYLHESQRLNFCVTPYHRMYVKKYWDKNSKTGLSFEEYVKIARDSKTGRFTKIGKVAERGFRLIPISELAGKWWNIYKRAGGRWEGEEREFFELPGYIRSYGRRWYNNGTKLGKERLRQIPSKNIPMNLWLKFFGYWLADGWVEGSKSGNCKNYIISLSASKYVDEVRKVIAELCDLLGVKWRERKREGKYYNKEYKTPLHVFEFQSKQLWLYLSKIGNAHTKYIPQEFKELCPKQLKILVEWMLKGDGTGLDTSHPQYTTRNKRLADDFQEVALKAGYAATISECDGEYFVSLSEEDEVLTTKEEGKWISYDGYVYCVSVPNEIILVRRRGKTLWSGNSKSSLDIWRNAARNMVIAGGGDNVGDANPYWRKLRNLMQKYGIKSWMELEERIKNKDVPSEMANFFIECLDAPRTNWGIETRQLCVDGNTMVITPTCIKPIKDCRAGEYVLAYDFKARTPVWSKVTAFIETLSDDIYEIRAGKRLRITGDNMVWTTKGWIPARNLKGEKVLNIVSFLVTHDEVDRRGGGDTESELCVYDGFSTSEALTTSLCEGYQEEDRGVRVKEGEEERVETGGRGVSEEALQKDACNRDCEKIGEKSPCSSIESSQVRTFRGVEKVVASRTGGNNNCLHSGFSGWRGNYHNSHSRLEESEKHGSASEAKTDGSNCEHGERGDFMAERYAPTWLNTFFNDKHCDGERDKDTLSVAAWGQHRSEVASGEDFSILEDKEGTSPTRLGVHQIERREKSQRTLFKERNGDSLESSTIKLDWQKVEAVEKDGRDVQRVYDLETEHGNFFANGILIHNSKFFLFYNREYLTPEVLSKVREMPKQDRESAAKEFVTKCYFFLLGRHPDGAGLEHYTQKLLSGDMSEEDVAVSIAESAEFRERMSGLSVEDIVNRCYNLVLDRNVDDSGLRTYGGMLRDGRMT
ncbi:hypothetical protein DRN52_05445, partial [Thermococci archaeon]